MASITFDDVRKVYPDGTVAVPRLDLAIEDGEFMAVVGPSGCGKSTALRMTAGLEDISGGRLLIGDRVVNGTSPQERDIAMVFQDYALYPHMTVAENIGFPLRMMKVPRSEQRRRVDGAAVRLGLENLLDRRPGRLSGGQRQRVAMGRAIVREPSAFLMDEPLSNLDAKLRVQMRAEIATLQRQLGVTTLYVTHDQVEALTMGDRVAVMRGGVLQQCAPPQDLYDRPANVFVAGFIGSPKMNLVDSRLRWGAGGDAMLAFGSGELCVPADEAARRGLTGLAEGPLTIGVRPEGVHHAPHADAGGPGVLDVTAGAVESLGPETLVHFAARLRPADQHDSDADPVEDDATVLAGDGAMAMCARLVPPLRISPGQGLRLQVQPEQLYFFTAGGDAVLGDRTDPGRG